jgi:hypothetical protein
MVFVQAFRGRFGELPTLEIAPFWIVTSEAIVFLLSIVTIFPLISLRSRALAQLSGLPAAKVSEGITQSRKARHVDFITLCILSRGAVFLDTCLTCPLRLI